MADSAFADTYRSLHIVGEHLLCAARYAAVGRIGLTVVPGGIATPPFGDGETVVGIVHGELVVRDGGMERKAPISSLRAAGEFVGVTPGAPAHVYQPATPCRLDEPLFFDSEKLDRICAWYGLVDGALRRLVTEIGEGAGTISLWPEHFDVAIRAEEVNYGGLAGDAHLPEPYVYVGPPTDALGSDRSSFWNQPFGATRTVAEIHTIDDAVEFFRRGRAAAAQLSAQHA